jgi:hypothetical protein
MRDQFVILIGTAVHIPFTAGMTWCGGGRRRRAGRQAPPRGSPAPDAGHARLALEKYPVTPNYPAEHLFTANTYML